MKEDLDQIKAIIVELKTIDNKKSSAKLDLNKCERLAEKLASLSKDCHECQQHLKEFNEHFIQLNQKKDQIDKADLKKHTQFIHHICSHLQKQHNLFPEGYYMGIYMSIGISLGIVFGLTIFDNIALGIPIGMCLGIAIGTGLDADVKKKGKTI